MSMLVEQSNAYTSYMVKDYGYVKRHIIFKTPLLKRNLEEYEEESNLCFDDFSSDIELAEISKDIRKSFDDEKELRRISQCRAKGKVKAMALLNDWDYFVTLTFDNNKVDRYDNNAVLKTTLTWLRNQYNKHGIKYLLIPEHHKDGAIHWHGFIQDSNNKLKLSKANIKSKKGHEVYNIDSWSQYKGFNTACKIDKSYSSRAKITNYVNKYITKDFIKIFDKHYYCSNGLLNEPKISYPKEVIDLSDKKVFSNDFCIMYDEIV